MSEVTMPTLHDATIDEFIGFVRELYGSSGSIPLHEPRFIGREREYVMDAIDSTFVSSVGAYVDRFEAMIRDMTGARHAVAVVNGTAALHVALKLSGVSRGDLVLTQPLTFIATCNAISYLGAEPFFVDVEVPRLGMSASALETLLAEDFVARDGSAYHKGSGRRAAACVPMHTFGFPAEIDRVVEICTSYGIPVVEDAAESLGSLYKGRHTGTFGLFGTYSFNGNKTVTCGGGGIIVTDDEVLGKRAKHITTTAKIPHSWEYRHDEVGFNYRCPNLNAALACAQLEQLGTFVDDKRETASRYKSFFDRLGLTMVGEQPDSRANHWLNTILLPGPVERELFLRRTNAAGIMTRPVWTLMHHLPMFKDCRRAQLHASEWIAERAVNIPSSVRV